MSRGSPAAFFLVAAAALAAADGWAATIHVDVTNLSGVEDGTVAHPYNTIQEGVDHALGGDKVQVHPGTYKESLLMKDGVSVVGNGAGSTVIDGTGIENSVVTFNGTRLSPLLSGFTIKGGHGDQISEQGGFPVFAGGGVLILDSSAIVVRNVITQNTLTQGYCLGAGIYVRANAATPQILDNLISGNTAVSGNVAGSGDGGGIYVVTKSGSVVVQGNVIESNQAVRGGGVFVDNATSSTVGIRRNVLRNNNAKTGGAIFSQAIGGSVSTVVDNVVVGNGNTAAGAQGGGIVGKALGTGSFAISNNTFSGNAVAAGNGGAIWLDDTTSTLANVVANNVLSGNTALHGGGIDHTAFHGTIRNNDFNANPGGNLYNAGGSGAVIVGSLLLDPQFVSPAQGNFRLLTGSPCIDAAFPADAPANDLDGFSRPFDGDANQTAVSDIGAHEYPAGEVLAITFAADKRSLGWPTLAAQDAFNIYRGSLARLRSTGQYTQDPLAEPLAARFCSVTAAQLPFPDLYVPPAGQSVFYLATAVIDGWEGPLGPDRFGLPRPNDNSCP
ncbi:MAG TPA: right-handed parallel beta-helix repeat-containing protein [Candidatus Polarisedimenticolaceae bacterium]|nr:right-handed parallel beta-helix repeat-containing protein [Candidatus Polarisedimenticolaceae bacterium]